MKENESIFDVLKTVSASEYLRATPFSVAERLELKWKVSEKFFFDEFYAESERAKRARTELLERLRIHPETAVILRGYSGCGKTTFLRHMVHMMPDAGTTIIDFESGWDPGYTDTIRCFVQCEVTAKMADDLIYHGGSTLSFFQKHFFTHYENYSAITRHLDKRSILRETMKSIQNLWEDYSEEGSVADEIKANLKDSVNANLDRLTPAQILEVCVLWDIAAKLSAGQRVGNIFFFDNLDNVIVDELGEFIEYFTSCWMNLRRVFRELDLPRVQKDELCQAYSFILAVRETTYARLSEHLRGRDIFFEKELSGVYSQKKIVARRTVFLQKNESSLTNCEKLCQDVYAVNGLMSDSYIERHISPLFNGSYGKTIDTICTVCTGNQEYIQEYSTLIQRQSRQWRRGAHAIILSMFFRHFHQQRYFSDNLRLYDFTIRYDSQQRYLYSPARLILTYLSNVDRECLLPDFIDVFNGIIEKEDVVETLFQLYRLRESSWRHLITFDRSPMSDENERDRQLALYNGHVSYDDVRFSTFEITKAGKTFLKSFVPHFEFYSTRLSDGTAKPLFFRKNLELNLVNGKYYFQEIIEKVYAAVEDCCRRLKLANEEICVAKNWRPDRLSSSDFVLTKPGSTIKQFHGERLIFSHIGYINTYRRYLVSLQMYGPRRVEWNKILTEYICEYLELYESNQCDRSRANIEVAKTLRKQLDTIIRSEYMDFTTAVETASYE